MIELVARARRFGREIAPVVGIDGTMQRNAPDHLDAGLGEAVELGRIVGQEPHALAAEHLQHARRDAVVALVVVESKRGIGVDRIEAASCS